MNEAKSDYYVQLATLRQNLVDRFSDEELRTLCFDFGVDYEDLPSQGKAGKARELTSCIIRTGRMSEFIETCHLLRPNTMWEFTLGTVSDDPVASRSSKTALLDEMFREATRYHLAGQLSDAFQLYRQLQQLAPDYPHIEGIIAAVGQELRRSYVDPYGRVREFAVLHPDESIRECRQMPASPPARPSCLGRIAVVVAAILTITLLILVYLWLRGMLL